MEPTKSSGPGPAKKRNTEFYKTFIDSIEAAEGNWIETPLNGAAGQTHTSLCAEAGRRYAEIVIRDSIVYGRLLTP